VHKARNVHERIFPRGLAAAERQERGTSRIFTNLSRSHAQRSFVMFFAGVACAELSTVRKPSLSWHFEKPIEAVVLSPKRLLKFR